MYMNIRTATANDLPRVLELNEEALPHVNSLEIKDMEWFLEHAHRFVAVEVEKVLIGFMIVLEPGLDYKSLNYSFFCNNYSNFEYVDRIVIAETHRGQRVGTALYQQLFDQTEKKRITCEVNVEPPNPASLAFHRFLGFKEVARQQTNGGTKKVEFMVKEL
ncbi:hypothetical protein SAMN06265219_102153 [Gracilimonas mengyeensis]|uniref:N-acetyltransferase domain-containing protein n=2 Tax=Gracilimonas mengyeensis TaxID=1302730 RepID=A0A521BB60_9BACT|nr:hypothetical protein SAMN06265219_102153 [Gracilimonas mengyeensis]